MGDDDHDLAADLRRVVHRAFALVDGRTTDMADEVWYEPVGNYADADRHAREIDVLFRRTPLLVGLSCDWPETGSFRTHDLIPGAPLLLERGFAGVERCTLGLTEVGCREWHGMVWVVATPGAEVDVEGHLGPLAPLLRAYDFARARRFVAHTLPATNWKLAVDTYLEGYHFASLHPRTINYDNVMVFDAFGPHTRQGFPRRNLHELRGQPEAEWNVHHHLTCVHQLFPNIAFTVSNEGILVNAVYPGARFDESVTVQTHYTRAELPTTPSAS